MSLFSSGTTPAPSETSEFDCFALNVMGEGIDSLTTNIDPKAVLEEALEGAYCSYPGASSLPVEPDSGASMSVKISSGTDRIVQVAGIEDPDGAYCGSGKTLSEVIVERGSIVLSKTRELFFELGRARVDVFNDLELTIEDEYTADDERTRRDMACSTSAIETCGGDFLDTDMEMARDHTHTLSPGFKLAQKIAPSTDRKYAAMEVDIAAALTTQVSVSLQTDNTGNPSGTPVSSSSSVLLSPSEVPGTIDSVKMNFSSSVNLEAGQTYWLVIEPVDSSIDVGTTGDVGSTAMEHDGQSWVVYHDRLAHAFYICND